MTNVLVVDDTSTNLKILEILLKKQGCLVTSFEDPNEALDWFKTSTFNIDLAILDFEMPEKNGSQLALELRECGFKGKCLILTALGTLDIEALPSEAKIDSILNKPINLTDVTYILKRWGEKAELVDCRFELRKPNLEVSQAVEVFLFQDGIYHTITIKEINASGRGIGAEVISGALPKPGAEIMLSTGQNYSVRWVRTLRGAKAIGLCRIEPVEDA
ncbi:MAG: response regulator [Pseudomonadota bacterium]|nr:response regulator [Pseudomonadota bacterium]